MKTRYREDQLIPVTRTTAPTRRRDAPDVLQTWEAASEDGAWAFWRTEGTGSNWTVRHLPTGYTPLLEEWLQLDDARRDVVTGYMWAALWRDAHHRLTLREWPGPAGDDITDQDMARGYLDWAVDHGHAQE